MQDCLSSTHCNFCGLFVCVWTICVCFSWRARCLVFPWCGPCCLAFLAGFVFSFYVLSGCNIFLELVNHIYMILTMSYLNLLPFYLVPIVFVLALVPRLVGRCLFVGRPYVGLFGFAFVRPLSRRADNSFCYIISRRLGAPIFCPPTIRNRALPIFCPNCKSTPDRRMGGTYFCPKLQLHPTCNRWSHPFCPSCKFTLDTQLSPAHFVVVVGLLHS